MMTSQFRARTVNIMFNVRMRTYEMCIINKGSSTFLVITCSSTMDTVHNNCSELVRNANISPFFVVLSEHFSCVI